MPKTEDMNPALCETCVDAKKTCEDNPALGPLRLCVACEHNHELTKVLKAKLQETRLALVAQTAQLLSARAQCAATEKTFVETMRTESNARYLEMQRKSSDQGQ